MHNVFDWSEFQTSFTKEANAAGFYPTVLAELKAGPLTVWQRPGKGKHIYLSAGIHGDEPAGPLAILELLAQNSLSNEFQWTLCPALNPAGLAAGMRENAEGLDLNRDYWLRESQEVAAHADWLKGIATPDLFISLHEDWETTGFYFYEINLREDQPERAGKILSAVSEWFLPESGPQIDGHEIRADGWIYHAAEADLPEGWPEAIYLAKLGCPLSFTFETPSRAELHLRVAAHAAAVKAAQGNLILVTLRTCTQRSFELNEPTGSQTDPQ